MSRTWRGARRQNRGKKWTITGAAAVDFGLRFEDRVEGVLKEMVKEKVIDRFIHYQPGTPKKDFRIIRAGVVKDINITTSRRAWKSHYERFSKEVEVILISPHETDEGIKTSISHIFQNKVIIMTPIQTNKK